MKNTINPLISLEDLTEELIIEYFCTHPEFFQNHEDILLSLDLPHSCYPAVSLVERQVQLLREKNATLQQEMLNTIHIANDNGVLFDVTKRLTLKLLEAETLDQFITIVHDCLCADLNADALRIGLRQLPKRIERSNCTFAIKKTGNPIILDLLKSNQTVCKQFAKEQRLYLFGDAGRTIGSSAIVPLGSQGELGLLAIGSRNRRHFHREMDTLFLDYIGKICSQILKKL